MPITFKSGKNQMSFFDGTQPLRADKPIRLIELFAGIGAQAKALENLGVPFEHYRICEFDKYAVQSYNAVHGTNFETSDITKIHAEDLAVCDTDKYFYIMTYSFPCTDLSKAGKQQGMSRDSGTRSGLLWEVERLLNEMTLRGGQLPQLLLMENVPDVISEKNIKDFSAWCGFLNKLGYMNKYDILNSKDYGIPQNRERCFMLSWLGENFYYDFPMPKPLTIKLKDVLEPSFDEKYYLSEKTIKYFIQHTQESIEKGNGFRFEPTDGNVVGKTITTRAGSRMDDNFIKCEHIAKLEGDFEMANRVYSPEGLCPTIRTMQGGGLEPKILEEPIVWDGYNQTVRKDSSCVGTLTRNCGADLKRNRQGIIEPIAYDEQNKYLRKDGIVGTLTTDGSSPKHNNRVVEFELSDNMKKYINSYDDKYQVSNGNLQVNREIACTKSTREGCTRADSSDYISPDFKQNTNIANLDMTKYRVRKLTPKECWRLMGFDDGAFDRAKASGVSNSQLYKQAGNSIVVDVLMAILKPIVAKPLDTGK